MADLYPPSYPPPRQQQQQHPPPQPPQGYHPRDTQHYPLNPATIAYPPIMHNGGPPPPDESDLQSKQEQQSQKTDASAHTKPQATFLTKLYNLLERPENHHMIRWDPAGEYIIVEKPEQLALHVLPSVYRQSRFASFSRQLNIYGFMRKVNLRNVDPAIDDPDASTWSHPTLTRHSPPEVVANFKRRVPPRLSKPRKRDTDPTPASSATPRNGRPRGFSATGNYSPLNQTGAPTAGWGSGYPMAPGGPRGAPLPPLTVPSDPPPLGSHLYGHPAQMQPVSPADETPPPSSNGYPPIPPFGAQRDMMGGPPPSHHYPYATEPQSAASSAWSSNSSHSASLSSLLNPPNGSSYSRPMPQMHPDSRPNTGYSTISGYDTDTASPAGFDYSRPGSSHHRGGISPSTSRPSSSHRTPSGNYGQAPSSLSIRRTRRHSAAMSPYPSPYGDDHRGSTSPHPDVHDRDMNRRSLVSVSDHYGYNPTHGPADFAYTAGDGDVWTAKATRPSTSASSLSTNTGGSPDSNTPPVTSNGPHGDYGHDADVSRFLIDPQSRPTLATSR